MPHADLVIPHGYPLEEHHVVSKDGFILTAYRIPPRTRSEQRRRSRAQIQIKDHRPTNKAEALGRPVVLQHGLLDSCAGFLLLGPKKALAFLLADQGEESP